MLDFSEGSSWFLAGLTITTLFVLALAAVTLFADWLTDRRRRVTG